MPLFLPRGLFPTNFLRPNRSETRRSPLLRFYAANVRLYRPSWYVNYRDHLVSFTHGGTRTISEQFKRLLFLLDSSTRNALPKIGALVLSIIVDEIIPRQRGYGRNVNDPSIIISSGRHVPVVILSRPRFLLLLFARILVNDVIFVVVVVIFFFYDDFNRFARFVVAISNLCVRAVVAIIAN